jgi:thiol-disulfide isomerase/thioredoxin
MIRKLALLVLTLALLSGCASAEGLIFLTEPEEETYALGEGPYPGPDMEPDPEPFFVEPDLDPIATLAYQREEVLPFMRDVQAPSFALGSADGRSFSLTEGSGRVAVILFWTSWMDECLDSLGQLEYLAERYPDVLILTINPLPAESNQAPWSAQAYQEHIAWVNGYFLENGYPFPALIDADGEVAALSVYQSPVLPTTYFVDREGIMRISWQGRLSRQTIDTLMSMMLALDS